MMEAAVRNHPTKDAIIDRLRYYGTRIAGWRASESTERSDLFSQGNVVNVTPSGAVEIWWGSMTKTPPGEGLEMASMQVWSKYGSGMWLETPSPIIGHVYQTPVTFLHVCHTWRLGVP